MCGSLLYSNIRHGSEYFTVRNSFSYILRWELNLGSPDGLPKPYSLGHGDDATNSHAWTGSFTVQRKRKMQKEVSHTSTSSRCSSRMRSSCSCILLITSWNSYRSYGNSSSYTIQNTTATSFYTICDFKSN